jgi:hypothetical protein
MSDQEVLIGVIEYNEAKRLKHALEEIQKVSVRLANNPETCQTGGCKISVEVYARQEDLPRIGEYLEQEKQKTYEGLAVDFDLHNEVFDPEKGEARCPACGAQFSTQNTECPECGLVFLMDNQG